jgi:AraC-like DNA-binding protein
MKWFAISLTVAGVMFLSLSTWRFCTREPLRDKLKREHIEYVREWSASEEGQAIKSRYLEYHRKIGAIRNLRANHLFFHEIELLLEKPPKVELWHPDAAKFYSLERVAQVRGIYESEVDKPKN